MIQMLLADPWRLVQMAVTTVVALVLLNRSMQRLHAMCCCSSHALRLASVLMAVGGMAALLGALASAEEWFSWGQTILLAGIGLHVSCDKRRFLRGQGPLAALEHQALAEPARPRRESPELEAAGFQ